MNSRLENEVKILDKLFFFGFSSNVLNLTYIAIEAILVSVYLSVKNTLQIKTSKYLSIKSGKYLSVIVYVLTKCQRFGYYYFSKI